MIRFFEENNISIQLSDIKIITRTTSPKNQIVELFEHKLLGKVLIIDNEIQHIEAWASLYHESLIHIPASFIPQIKSVLILGGGSFFAAREVLKYESVVRVVMVDHDEEVIKIVRNNYSHVQPILDNPKYKLFIEDIHRFSRLNTEKFDLIVNDALDLLENGGRQFDIFSSFLSPQGVCSDLVYRHVFESERAVKTINKLRKKYNTAFSLVVIPEYPGIFHILSMWSKAVNLNQQAKGSINKVQKKWIKNKKSPCIYYNPAFINYYLYLPPYLRKWVTNL